MCVTLTFGPKSRAIIHLGIGFVGQLWPGTQRQSEPAAKPPFGGLVLSGLHVLNPVAMMVLPLFRSWGLAGPCTTIKHNLRPVTSI